MRVRTVSFVAFRWRREQPVRAMVVEAGCFIRQDRSWRDLLGKRFLIGVAQMTAHDRLPPFGGRREWDSRRGAQRSQRESALRELRSEPTGSDFLFRTKTQRHEDVVPAAKRPFPFTLRQLAATMKRRPCGREPASSCLCVFVRNEFGRRLRHSASFPACAHLCDLCANSLLHYPTPKATRHPLTPR